MGVNSLTSAFIMTLTNISRIKRKIRKFISDAKGIITLLAVLYNEYESYFHFVY